MSEQVNIEKIMAEIKAEIQQKGISLDLPDFFWRIRETGVGDQTF